MPTRHPLHAYLSDNAYQHWQRFTADNGISVTGLVESIGLQLPTGALDLTELVATARTIDAERRRRTPLEPAP